MKHDSAPDACRICGGATPDGLCHGLPSDLLARVSQSRNLVLLGARQSLYREGEQGESIYSVMSGTLKLHKLLSDGRRQIIRFLFPGDVFGFAQSSDGLYTTSAEALSPVQVCRFPRRKLEKLVLEMPDFGVRFSWLMVRELVAAQDQMVLLGRKQAGEKVASFLLDVSRRAVARGLSASPISLPMSRSDMADYLGLTIETVSRTLTRLKRDGVIALPTAGQVVLCHPQQLQDMADGQMFHRAGDHP